LGLFPWCVTHGGPRVSAAEVAVVPSPACSRYKNRAVLECDTCRGDEKAEGRRTAYAGGCTSGHAISGLADFQLPSLIAVIGFFAGGLAATYFILLLS
jgi:hypothetical protein